jgi:26S proteasome regulatory subunit N2
MQSQSSQQYGLSSSKLLAQLNSTIVEQQVYALRKLNQIVDHQWHEISDQIPRIESFVDDQTFPQRQLAATVASKVLYHLDEHDEALRLALEAGDHFDIQQDNKYVNTLVHKCIDIYTTKRVLLASKKDETVVIDPKMEAIVNRKFDQCFKEGMFKQAIGVALETRRCDKIQEAIEKSENPEDMLGYTFTLAVETIKQKDFRIEVLRMILLIYQTKPQGAGLDYFKIAKCQFHLGLPESTAILLAKLIVDESNNMLGPDYFLQAFQIAFDIVDKENQTFTSKVIQHLTTLQETSAQKARMGQLIKILKGEITERLYLQFLKKNNHTDMLLIGKIKDSIGNRNSMLHSATVWCNGIMNAYTTNDAFLKDQHSWISSATNWNRFMSVATLGMIHMGNKAEAEAILNPYFTGIANPD